MLHWIWSVFIQKTRMLTSGTETLWYELNSIPFRVFLTGWSVARQFALVCSQERKKAFPKYKKLLGRPWQWHLVAVWNDSSPNVGSTSNTQQNLNQSQDSFHLIDIWQSLIYQHNLWISTVKHPGCSFAPLTLLLICFSPSSPQVDVSMAASLPQKPGMPGIPPQQQQQQQQPLLQSAVPPGQQQMPPQGALREISPVFLCRIGQETVQDIVTRTMEIFQITRATQVSTMTVALNQTWANCGPGGWYIFSAVHKNKV